MPLIAAWRDISIQLPRRCWRSRLRPQCTLAHDEIPVPPYLHGQRN